MPRTSIRLRLTIWYSLALAAGLTLFALAIWVSMRHSLLRDIDNGLAEQQHSVQTFLVMELNERDARLEEELDEYSHALPPNTILRVTADHGSFSFASKGSFPWPPTPGVRRFQRVRWQDQTFRVVIQNISAHGREWTLALAASLDRVQEILDRLRMLLLTMFPLVIAIGATGGNWLSRRALKPVDAITAAAQSISISNLSERLEVPATGDELQRLSETWNSMLSRLESAVKRLSRFTADASHELRTPLAIIRSTAEIASRRSRSAESYRAALEQIVTDSERMTQLVEDLLFLARSDAENLSSPMRPVELGRLVADVGSRFEALAASRAVRLTLDLPDSPAYVAGDDVALRRLVLLLLDNAIKFCRSTGSVSVSLRAGEDRRVRLAITDCGPGIPDSEIPHIFDRFYRASGTSEGAEGSGLGLSLAHAITQQHRATIEVSSVPGEGSTFTVVFSQMAPANYTDSMRQTVDTHS